MAGEVDFSLDFKKATHGVQFEYPEKYRLIYINDILNSHK